RRSRSRVSSARAATPAVFCSAARGKRPSSPTTSSVVTSVDGDSRKRAVTSSPGASSAKPSTSNPHATFDTVAGAKAVTEFIKAIILLVTKICLPQRHREDRRARSAGTKRFDGRRYAAHWDRDDR